MACADSARVIATWNQIGIAPMRKVILALALVVSACGGPSWESAHKTCVLTYNLDFDACTRLVREFQSLGCNPEAMMVALNTGDSSEAVKHCPWMDR